MDSQEKRRGTPGWRSIHAAKLEILGQYRTAKHLSQSHTVKTFHGNVAESSFRKWLIRFLPKRYGVTSGYVITQQFLEDDGQIAHFDVIIYDRLEAPVLWVESNLDSSDEGTARAIPAEYVLAVLEVKSSFEPATIKAGIDKLRELDQLLSDVDDPNERYKKYLPSNFCCGLVFYELREKHRHQSKCLEYLMEGLSMRGFLGAIILEGEGLSEELTGTIRYLRGDRIPNVLTKEFDLLRAYSHHFSTQQNNDETYDGVMLNWFVNGFIQFMFDLIAIWNGKFEPGRVSSFHGLSYIELDNNQ